MSFHQEGIVSRRYRIIDEIGRGGMGVVYRALDRLTGQHIALKSVSLPNASNLTNTARNLRYALAQEFKLLASLRHPNIVSVLDYGFDADKKPYFTMELLEDHQTIIQYAKQSPPKEQIRLLTQMLQALAYLHRRGILHRDLKPENVMVMRGQVKVLDFGLATLSRQQEESNGTVIGTVAYLPPEILNNAPHTEASDLYAVGVMAYEIFAQRHPFDVTNVHALLRDIAFKEPDVHTLDVSVELQMLLAALLAKDPAERIADAHTVINTLAVGIGATPPPESDLIRESYLQSADFVGRDSEMNQLKAALQSAFGHVGSAWLIGGESGVGKSRLVDEIRTQALIAGALVLRSTIQRENSLPYQLWRIPLRHLALEVDIDDHAAAILRELVPDIETLLERTLPTPPELSGREGQQRLVGAITDLIRQQTRPIVLIMEDLQWAIESLEPLKPLANMAQELPFLFIGNYRNDELPELPEHIPAAQTLILERLTREEIKDFTAQIIGTKNIRQPVIDFLQNQTEGNAFFLVEVIRALADSAGSLSQIGRMTLPHNIYAGGVQHVFQQRLERIPMEAYPLLELAAVIGRDIVPEVLAECAPHVDIEHWLLTCAEAAVLEVVDERWRFTHDKLRQALQQSIPTMQQAEVHRKAALGIEATTHNLLENAPALMRHWRIAGDTEREAIYARISGEMQLNICAYSEAIDVLERALVLSPPDDTPERERLRARLTMRLGEAHLGLSNYSQAGHQFSVAEVIADPLGDEALTGAILQKQGLLAVKKGDYAAARASFKRSASHSREAEDWHNLAMTLGNLGEVEVNLGEYKQSAIYLNEAVEIAQNIKDNNALGHIYRSLSKLFYQKGDVDAGWPHLYAALNAVRQTGDRYGLARVLNAQGVFHATQGNYTPASEAYAQAIAQFRAIGDRWGEAVIMNNLGFVHLLMGDLPKSAEVFYQAITTLWELQVLPVLLESLVGLARSLAEVGRETQAAEIIGLAIQHPATIKDVDALSRHAIKVLQDRMPPRDYEQAYNRGSRFVLAEVVGVLLDDKDAVLRELLAGRVI